MQTEELTGLIGTHLGTTGQYYLRLCLGAGAFGAVYLAEQRILGQAVREVAIKITRVAGLTGDRLQETLGEALLLMKLLHESRWTEGRRHLVEIHDLGVLAQHGARGYIVMEYVRGPSLRGRIASFRTMPREQPHLPAGLAVDYARQICTGLAVAHSMEPPIVHGDLKPENILFEQASGRLKVADFGVAGQVNALIGQAEVLGRTPEYAAPEVFYGRSSCASDVYSIGLILYEMLTGIRMFEAVGQSGGLTGALLGNAHLRARQNTRIAPPSAHHAELRREGDRLDDLVLKCLANDDAARYPSARQLQADLERYQAGEPLQGPFEASAWPPEPLAPLDSREQVLKQARSLLAAGRSLDAAIRLSQGLAAHREQPDRLTVEMRVVLGDAQSRAGNPDEAARSYEEALRLDERLHVLSKGGRRRLYYQAADAHRKLGHLDLAESYERLAG